MASFWTIQKSEENLKLICMGVFIRSNWILVTVSASKQLNPPNDIVIKSGDQAVQNALPQSMQLDNMKKLHPDSKFKIVYVSNSEI